MKNKLLALLVITFSLQSTALGDKKPVAKDSSPQSVVHAFEKAFNDHRVDDMLALLSPDVVWFSIAGDSMTTEARGRDYISTWLKDYFKSLPSIRSSFDGVISSGSFIATLERPTWTTPDGPRSQQALGIYEVRDGKILRIWYFPSEKTTPKQEGAK